MDGWWIRDKGFQAWGVWPCRDDMGLVLAHGRDDAITNKREKERFWNPRGNGCFHSNGSFFLGREGGHGGSHTRSHWLVFHIQGEVLPRHLKWPAQAVFHLENTHLMGASSLPLALFL